MKRVFINLVTNAVQAMPKGGNLIITAEKNENYDTISLTDTGDGIPEELKPKLFTPLFTTKSKGQGFGLAVCKRIIEAHNGEISFDSEVGKGTTFTVRIPHLN
jgi:signal transduction histidine kinase